MGNRRTELTANGAALRTDAAHYGDLLDSGNVASDETEIARRFDRDGYLFLRGLLDTEDVIAARLEILTKYAIIGEIDDRAPILEAVAGDRDGLAGANLRAFTESVRTGARYEAVIDSPRLLGVISHLLQAAAVPFTMRWPRLARPGEGCGFHCDGPYMNRGTDRQLSAWIPLGQIEPSNGGLIVLEDSHQNEELRNGYLTMDADRDGLVWLDSDPVAVQARYGKRWLTTTYEPGDVLLFSMNTLHGAIDNASPTRSCRLSTDVRFYAEGEEPDPRWNGSDLEPHGPGRVFYPGLGSWANEDFQDEWKFVDERGRLRVGAPAAGDGK